MRNYEDLSDADKNELISNSINLLRSVTRIWGPEQGMELWETISEGLGPDLKGHVFFHLLTGNGVGDITLVKINPALAVNAIKIIRAATGYGLKEAKDIYDYVRDKGPKAIPVDQAQRAQYIIELNKIGCIAQ